MSSQMHRRMFVRTTGTAVLFATVSERLGKWMGPLAEPIKIGVIADLHQDVIHDAPRRLSQFLSAMEDFQPDALIQLGDFAVPSHKNRAFTKQFNEAGPQKLHVLGNHDMDSGHTRQQCKDEWGIPNGYYAHEIGGLLLLVLDGNEKGSEKYKGGYPKFIGPKQVEWLKEQLSRAHQPVIVISHQPLAGPSAIDNAKEVQGVLTEQADKVLFAMNGHTHIDYVVKVGDVVYWHVNSASYYWVGGDFTHPSYTKEIHRKFPYLAYTCPYQEPLYAALTIDPKNGMIRVEGTNTKWQGPSPLELQVMSVERAGENSVRPRITHRDFGSGK